MLNPGTAPSPRTPLQINVPNNNPEDINMEQMVEWLRTKRSLFGIGKNDQHLVHSLRDPASREKMANIYANTIVGFKKTPDVTLTPRGQITQEMIDLLKEYELPTSYPARLNLPQGTPNGCIHSTGPVAETAVMLFNQIITQFIPLLVGIAYYGLCNPVYADALKEHSRAICQLIEEETSKQVGTPYSVALIVKQKVADYIKKENLDTSLYMQRRARDLVSGNNPKDVYAVQEVCTLLGNYKSYIYLRDVIKQLYCMVVNEFKVYQKYDQKTFKQAESVLNKTSDDVKTQTIVGAVLPSGIAVSPTITPIVRLNMSADCAPEAHQMVQNENTSELRTVNSIARYRLVCKKSGYSLSAFDRYAPQLFLSLKYVCDLDIEFYLDHHKGEGYIYRINRPGSAHSINTDPLPYDSKKILEINQKIKIRVKNHLENTGQHTAVLVNDTYTQSNLYKMFQYVVGPYEAVAIDGQFQTSAGSFQDFELHNSSNVNIIYSPNKQIRLQNRTNINRMCQTMVSEDKPPDKPPMNFAGIIYTGVEHDYPDYLHYNYAYHCAYDIAEYNAVNVVDARKWFRARKRKKNMETKRKRDRFELASEDYQ